MNKQEFDIKLNELNALILQWAEEAGFQKVGVSDIDLSQQHEKLNAWLEKKFHGDMRWMEDNKEKRFYPEKLLPQTCRIISFRMDYLPPDTQTVKILKTPEKAFISRYALGRDYHKLIRKRLANIITQIARWVAQNKFKLTPMQRAFVDSAPVLERPIAAKAGLGWTGKHTLILDARAGSWFFLGEIFTNIPLPVNTERKEDLCGSCEACLKVCPTDAFPRPYELDARRCISYLTIENKGAIPEEFREVMGNRVFGCDDCQLICPWNKYAKTTREKDFLPRHDLDHADLLTLFCWDEETFLRNTAGSAIRRIGFERWQRNLAIGLGNAPSDTAIVNALEEKLPQASPLVREHIEWALRQQKSFKKNRKRKIKNRTSG